jgi:hypothetical protein
MTRVVRDDPSKGDMHNRQAIAFRKRWRCLTDYDMWPLYLIGLTWDIPFTPPTAYLTLILRSLGFNTLETNLLTVPSLVLIMIQVSRYTSLFYPTIVIDRVLLCSFCFGRDSAKGSQRFNHDFIFAPSLNGGSYLSSSPLSFSPTQQIPGSVSPSSLSSSDTPTSAPSK